MNLNVIRKGLWEFKTYPVKVAELYGGSELYWRGDMAWCLLKYGARPIDYYRFEFFRLNRHERKRYLTFYKYLKVAHRLIKSGAIVGDKVKEYRRYSEYIKRSWLYTPDATEEEIRSFVNDHSPLIAKPNNGEQGRGVIVVSKEKLNNDLLNDLKISKYLLEEKLTNCSELAAINSSSLNTLRIYTMIDNKGVPHILSMMLRVGKAGSKVDNWGAGGVGYEIDLKTGFIVGYGIDKQGGRHIVHPGTDFTMPGFKIPKYAELLKLIDTICRVDSKVRFVGWDIALTPNGFELIEMNCPAGHDFLQTFGKSFGKTIKDLW